MPQDPIGFTPDPDPFAGFTPDPVSSKTPDQMSDLERQVLGLPPKKPDLSWYDPDYWVPMALRTAPAIAGGILGGTAGSIVPFAGTMAGTAVGGGAGSFLGENLAQGYEYLRGNRNEYNPYSVGVNTALGAIPGLGKAPGLQATGKELIKYAVKAPVMGAFEGGILGGASTIPQEWAETGNLPTLSQVGTGAAVGAGMGAATAGALGSIPAVRKARAIRPEIPPVHTPVASVDLPLNPVVESPTVAKSQIDPNYNQGIGDPELAGTVPYKAKSEPINSEAGFTPETIVPQKPWDSDFLDRMDEASLEDFIARQSKNPNYTGTEQGQKLIAYAQYLLNEKTANPVVPISPELPKEPQATNLTPENIADIEAMYRFQRMYKEGKIPDDPSHPMMIEWAKIYNRVKDLKPNGSFEISPNRFDTLPEEPPPFTEYVLPDGRRVKLDTSAVKGAETTEFGTAEGPVTATRADIYDASVPPKEEVQFVDPNTGEIKPASQAKPGDVLLPKEEVPPVQPPSRNSRRFGLAGVEQGQVPADTLPVKPGGGLRPPPPENPPFDTSGFVPPEGTPPARDPRLANAQQQAFPGIEPQRPKGWVTEDKLKPGVPIKHRKPAKAHEQTTLGRIWDTPRSLQSIDAPGITSAALRQSRPLTFTADWFRAWGRAFGSFTSPEALKAMNNTIKENKYFKPQYEARYNANGELSHYVEQPSIAEKAGLLMSDVVNNREDAIRSSLAEQIPGYGRYVKASNRAYTAFLNHLRVTKFEQMMEAAILQGKGNDEVLQKKIADLVNNATGRGSLKFAVGKGGKYSLDLEPLASELGHALYSPRALAARLAFMNPSNYITADPLIRKEYWKGMARMVGSWAAFAGLGNLAGGEVGFDYSSSDAGKVKFGNKRIDPGAGWLQLMHLVGKEYYGGSTSTTTGKFNELGENMVSGNRWTPVQRYLYNQMNPSTRYVVDLIGTTKREPFDLTDRTLQLALPMFVDDIAQAAQEDDLVLSVFSGILGSAGIGGQTYDKGGFGKPTITPAIESLTGWEVPTFTFGGKK